MRLCDTLHGSTVRLLLSSGYCTTAVACLLAKGTGYSGALLTLIGIYYRRSASPATAMTARHSATNINLALQRTAAAANTIAALYDSIFVLSCSHKSLLINVFSSY